MYTRHSHIDDDERHRTIIGKFILIAYLKHRENVKKYAE